MSDPAPKNDNLSDISHLFLSSVRDRATGSAPRPMRTPPKPPVSIDLTPEEFEKAFAAAAAADAAANEEEMTASRAAAPAVRVTAVIASHITGKSAERIADYARHLAADGTRIGLIEVDSSEFRVVCFDRFGESSDEKSPAESFDPREMKHVLDELSWDVQHWLLVLPHARIPEARVLLRNVEHWALLSTCDHDGVVSCYRAIKNLIDLWPAEKSAGKPRLSLALLDGPDAAYASRVGEKLSGACEQFLHWPLALEPHVLPTDRVNGHVVLSCRPLHDKSQLANAPQWQIVADFIARSRCAPEQSTGGLSADGARESASRAETVVATAVESALETTVETTVKTTVESTSNDFASRSTMPQTDSQPPVASNMKFTPMEASTVAALDMADVIDLPASSSEDGGIIEAVLRHSSGELIECPVAPPMCPKAKLAVGRDHRIVMLAVSRDGLADLTSIGHAFRWLQENQNLIGMAMPQLSIDTQQRPHLNLLVNQSRSTAQTLGPMFQGDHVTVKTYRKLRWGGKTGLLLEAA